jgi:hypothetical protein
MKDVWQYIWKEKKWWLIPPIAVIVLIGILIAVSAATPVSPFIYMLF